MGNATVKVLLVDDNDVFRDLAARFLSSLPGITLAGTANGGEAGLLCAQELRPDLVLMDLHMRDANGLDVIPRLRHSMPEIGIIALSLLDPNGFRAVTLEAGADEFVDKMSMVDDLMPAILKVSKQKEGWLHQPKSMMDS